MRQFRFGLDPLCLLSCLLYGVNRFWIKRHLGAGFMHDHFNDLLLIPAGLPWVLWLSHRLGLRPAKHYPSSAEVGAHLLLWAFICEGIGPRLIHHGTADWRDAVAYGVGALLSLFWWQHQARRDLRA